VSERRVFLSYRREDAAGHAGRLTDHLLDRFGQGSVFVDVDSIEAGADFTAEIERAIAGSDAVLVVIGPGWLDARTPSGVRRLDEPADFVRREVEAALSSEVRVIPVLVGGAEMPAEAELPDSIAALAHRNAVELQDRRWREDVDALVDVLEGHGRGTVGNLPPQPTPFLGRERELAELTELVRSQDVRLLTLTGPGGIGKTRLAIQAAAKLVHTYPGGAWFVGLGALTDPGLVLVEIARVLEVFDATEDRLVPAIVERVARARTLVVLDNLEQILPGAAGPIADLSSAAPMLDVLCSSREPLRVSAEREYPVPTLSEHEAEALFIQRARAADPGFEPQGAAEQRAIGEVCDRLDRLPLAIELAAARTKMLRPGALLHRLEQRLPLLTGGARDVPERQRTLRATIAWSYDLCSETERELFERLAVFSGGWTLEAAEAVCGADLDTLQSLVERSLVRREPEGRRFQMLETIREFANERFERKPHADALRRLHAKYFVADAEQADAVLQGGPPQREQIAHLDAEHDNHRAILRWALGGTDSELALRLAAQLGPVWWLRRPLSEARRWLTEALEAAPPVATRARSLALDWAGFLAGEQGEDGTALLEASIECAKEAGDVAIQALATTNLAGNLPASRRKESVPLAREGVRLARISGQRWVLAIALNNLGETYRQLGETAAATGAYEEGLAAARDLNHPSLIALCLANLAEIAVAHDPAHARSLAAESLALAEEIGDRRHTSVAQTVLGWAALAEGKLDEALEWFGEGLTLTRDLGHAQWAFNILYGFAGVAAAKGEVARAARLEAAAARSERILGHQPTAADAGIHRRYLDELRSSTDRAIWEAETRAGEAMSLDEAIAYALEGNSIAIQAGSGM
jgi:predicted ATPase